MLRHVVFLLFPGGVCVDSFAMKIAGTVLGVQPMFESTREYCKPYLTNDAPEFLIHVDRNQLALEQALLEQEAVEQGIKPRKFKEPFLERATIQRQTADHLIDRNSLMLHGSTICVDGKAYLFTAPCGTGKSTHTRLWRELLGTRAVMVNDDKPFLRISPTGVLACGSPWCGKHGLAANICVPLAGICSLHRGQRNSIRSADGDELLEILRLQSHIPEDPMLAQKTFSLIDSLRSMVPLWVLHCNQDLEAARVAYDAMSNHEWLV